MEYNLGNLKDKVITLRSVYKEKQYSFQPVKQANGLNLPFVKSVRIGNDGSSEMILSEAERNDPESAYFLPEDMNIIVTEGTTFDMRDPLQRNKWLAIRNSSLIAPTRDARDDKGNLLIDGTKDRYGMAEIYVDVPGEESERSVEKKKKITRAWSYIENDSVEGLLTKCKLLGRQMLHAPVSDVQDYLYQIAEKTPAIIIELYTGTDTALKLMLIDAKEKNIIKRDKGLYLYGDTVLGASDDAVIAWFKTPINKTIFEYIRNEVYPEIAKAVSDAALSDNAAFRAEDINSWDESAENKKKIAGKKK